MNRVQVERDPSGLAGGIAFGPRIGPAIKLMWGAFFGRRKTGVAAGVAAGAAAKVGPIGAKTNAKGLTPITVTNPNIPGYKGYSAKVHEFHGIVLDVLWSGIRPPRNDGTFRTTQSPVGFAGSPSVYDIMETVCKKKHGAGWQPVPLEFRLTRLKFAGLETGLPPRKQKDPVEIPFNSKKGYGVVKQPRAQTRLAHFFIDGFWVFRCKKGKQVSELYAISTDFKVRTIAHAPYDQAFARKVNALRLKHKNDKSFVIGRPYDRSWGMMKKSWFKGVWLEGMQAISNKLKVGSAKAMLTDIKKVNIISAFDRQYWPEDPRR